MDDEENSWDGDEADFQDADGDYAEHWDEDDDQDEPPPELPDSDEGEEAEWWAWLAFKDARKGVQDERNRRGFSTGKGGKNRPPRPEGKGGPSSGPRDDQRRAQVDELKRHTSCRDCGRVGHWSGDKQCPKAGMSENSCLCLVLSWLLG